MYVLQVKKVGTAPERVLAKLQAELQATDKRHRDAMITKETTEFIVKRITKARVPNIGRAAVTTAPSVRLAIKYFVSWYTDYRPAPL